MSHGANVTAVSKNLLCQQMSGQITQQDRRVVCHIHFQKEKASPHCQEPAPISKLI